MTMPELHITRIGRGEYSVRVVGEDDRPAPYVYAPTKAAVPGAYWADRYRRLVETVQETRRTRDGYLALIGQALRSDGIVEVPANDPTIGMIELAQTMGFLARSHSRDGRKYLFVVESECELDRRKSRIDLKSRRAESNPS